MTTNAYRYVRNNPNDVREGEEVILDDRHKVRILYVSKLEMYATVQSGSNRWDVMTYRLRKKK